MNEKTYDNGGRWEIHTVDDLRTALADAGVPYYVYVLCRQAGEAIASPFYVGVGQRDRLFDHEAEARDPKAVGTKVDIVDLLLFPKTGLTELF
jgi:hypothetical protein